MLGRFWWWALLLFLHFVWGQCRKQRPACSAGAGLGEVAAEAAVVVGNPHVEHGLVPHDPVGALCVQPAVMPVAAAAVEVPAQGSPRSVLG